MFALVTDDDALLARLAAAVNAFDGAADGAEAGAGGSGGWWTQRFHPGSGPRGSALNLKKAGSFALVHGVRALALA